MSDPRLPARRRGLRRALSGLALLLLAVLVVVLGAPWWFDARRVSAIALERAGAATGLDWHLGDEPELRWRPRPWLALPELRVTDGRGRTVLSARRLELALPWSTLRGESLRIEAVRLDGPRVDTEAALDWWRAQPPSADRALPELDGLRITDGRLTWPGGGIEQLQLVLPRFAINEALALELSARIRLDEAATQADAPAPAPASVSLTIAGTPRTDPMRIEGLSAIVTGDRWVPEASLRGHLQFAPWQIEAEGELAAWPAAWPALPPPIGADASPVVFAISQAGEGPLDAAVRLSLRRGDNEMALRGAPATLRDWIEATGPEAPLLPPIEAEARMPSIDLDGVRLEGIHLRIDDDTAEPSTEGDPAR